MTGLYLLQHAKGLSDDAVCAAWVENPYDQAFTGEVFFQHQLPLGRSSMSRWRGRIGKDELELLLAETLAAAARAKAVDVAKFERVTIDSTAPTKAIAHPTDSGLLLRAVEWLNRLAKHNDLVLSRCHRLEHAPLLNCPAIQRKPSSRSGAPKAVVRECQKRLTLS